MDIISLLGSAASIGAAIIAVYSAIKVNKIKNEIIGKLHLDKTSGLLAVAKTTQIQINKICKPKEKLRGVNTDEITSSLLNFQSDLIEYKDILISYDFENHKETYEQLSLKIKELRYEKDRDKIRLLGDELYAIVSNIISELGRISRSKVEN